jgi:hypothetical protein
LQFHAHADKLMNAGQHFTITDCPGLRLTATATRRSWIYRYKNPADATMLGNLGDLPVGEVTRSLAFDLLESNRHIPVQCTRLRAERGAAWDDGLDSRIRLIQEVAAHRVVENYDSDMLVGFEGVAARGTARPLAGP